MIVYRELELKIGGKNEIIQFGIPNSQNELDEMFSLRYNVYSERGYIHSNEFPNKQEKDKDDIDGKSAYFIAKIKGGKTVGTIRVISGHPLPMERDCFEFEEPKVIEEIPKDKRVELGRLVAIPYDKERGLYFPRNIILLFLIDVLIMYANEKDIKGGYIFIKSKLKEKMKKLKMPIRPINEYKQIYSEYGILWKYFNQNDDKAFPFYFITSEIEKYIEKLLSKNIIFKKVDEKRFVLKTGLYNKFLKLFKII